MHPLTFVTSASGACYYTMSENPCATRVTTIKQPRIHLGDGLLIATMLAISLAATADERPSVSVAVATNFLEAIDLLAPEFEAQSGIRVVATPHSTGKLYAQIVHGAPFDVFLSADQHRPRLLERQGLAVAGSRFTYAIGRIALWSPDPARIGDDGAAILRAGEFRRLAIANPDLAPYGAAAREALMKLDVWSSVEDRLVFGENIGQTFAVVATGNAEMGVVALSYARSRRNTSPGSHWEIPRQLYAPIRQDAVLLPRALQNLAAAKFVTFLRSAQTLVTIRNLGYAVVSRPIP